MNLRLIVLKNPNHVFFFQWEVAAGVTDIFYKLLRDHEPRLENFMDQPIEVQGGGTTIANKAPGHHLLIHLLNDSDMLRLVRWVYYQSEINA